jgi:hypothetical protein
VLLLVVQPHKRKDVRFMAFGIQTATVLIFCLALWIMLFTLLDEVDSESDLAARILGFESIDSLVATVITINLVFLGAVVFLTVYQTVTSEIVQVLRVSGSRQLPDLDLKANLKYHLFLSHIWSSGQGTSLPH